MENQITPIRAESICPSSLCEKVPRDHPLTWPDTRATSLDDLPNEILLKIFSFVDLHREARIMGYIPDDPPPSPPDQFLFEDFLMCNRWLQNIALTSKRFAALIPEVQLHAIVLSAISPDMPPEFEKSNVSGLMRNLHTRPELRRHLQQLRICFSWKGAAVPREVAHQWNRMLDSHSVSSTSKAACCNDAAVEPGCYKVLLAMLPELKVLCISSLSQIVSFGWVKQFSDTPLRSLRVLKIESEVPRVIRGIELLQQLQTLDLSMRLQGKEAFTVIGSSDKFLAPAAAETFRNIKHLRLDFEVRTIGIWNRAGRTCMSNVVQGFRNLESLTYYTEPSSLKNPYRSVRAFPTYQANIQAYPEAPSPAIDASFETSWDRAIYDARNEITDYQFLVDSIVHLRPTLQFLQLPGGFWTLPGSVRKPLPRFNQFTELQKLIVPQAAIISIKLENMLYEAVFEGDFELSALTALPVSLQHLKIFDVDETFLESEWLQGLFREQKNHSRWPDLEVLEILMAPTFSNGVAGGFETGEQILAKRGSGVLEAVLTRQRCEAFWAMVDEAAFKVIVCRDE